MEFESSILGEERTVLVYLPAGYDPDLHPPYPVVYLLHEFGGDAFWWRNWVNIDIVLDRLIHTEEIIPMIVAMPDGNSVLGGSFFSRSIDELHRPPMEGAHSAVYPVFGDSPERIGWETPFLPDFESYLIHEVIPEVDRRYNTRTDPSGRGVEGVGMGGYGAIMMGLHYPDVFRSVACHGAYFAFFGTSYRQIREINILPAKGGSAGLFDLVPQLVEECQLKDGAIELEPFVSEKPLTSLFFAMGSIFSPNVLSPEHVLDKATGAGCDLPIGEIFLRDTDNDGIPEGMEDVNDNGVVDGLEDLDEDGLIDGIKWHVWNRWLDHDPVLSIYRESTFYRPVLERMNLYFDCGNRDSLHLHRQATVFQTLLYGLGFEKGEEFHFTLFDGAHLDYLHDAVDDAFVTHSDFFRTLPDE
jgi:hypothetical protein